MFIAALKHKNVITVRVVKEKQNSLLFSYKLFSVQDLLWFVVFHKDCSTGRYTYIISNTEE